MQKMEKNKGITLIALIVTIVVLLILAGVTINAITGSESAMEKATEAREKDKQGTELETIKLAVVNAVASDLTGLVNADNLKEGLNGLVEDEGRLRINKDNSPWIVTGKTGMKYKINQNGEITSAEPVSSVEFINTEDTIAVGKSKKLEIIAKGASGNKTEANEVIFYSSDEDIATVEDDGSIKIVNDDSKIGETVTISVVADEIVGSNECEITVNPDYKIGSNITYVTSHNDVELRDWKIFYKTENYVYLILSDFLPSNAIGNISGIIQKEASNYAVKSSNNRAELINAMTTKANWTSLLKGTINGKSIDYRSSEGENIYAMGSPTLELFVQSWNEKYPNNEAYPTNQIYIAQTTSTMNDGLIGYYASRTSPATTTWVSMSGSEGYVNQQNMDNQYFQYSSYNYKGTGYWLATPNAEGENFIFTAQGKAGALNCNGYSCRYANEDFALRPIVCLPIAVLE